jgi:KDO2-lipid IV(A) lauroyltransferase
MEYLGFLFFMLLITLFAIMPFFLIYGLSEVVWFFLYKVVGYRKKVVRDNLMIAFPDKTDKEIKKIESKYYRNLTDILLESVKGYTMGNKTALKRYRAKNFDIVKKYHDEGRGVIIAIGHIANWEWGTNTLPWYLENNIYIAYKPIGNRYIDSYVKKSRSKNGAVMFPLRETNKFFKRYAKTPSSFILVSDQNPSNPERAIWVDFFGKKTAFLHGIEYYTQTYNMPVIFYSITRLKRGHYEIDFSLIHDNPKDLKPGEITQMYASKLEEEIRKHPETWLWSHKRWKHSR